MSNPPKNVLYRYGCKFVLLLLLLILLLLTLLLLLQAYMLNPAIYSQHLKLHPLMVLSTLVIAEHNMGVWGLLGQ